MVGEVMAEGAFSLKDTEAMAWEGNPGIPGFPGFKRRLLFRDDAIGAEVRMDYVPPGIVPGELELPHRHYHNSVTERAYTLSGDFPHWEFSSVEDHAGELIVFRRHLFMDRPPKSIHGLLAEPVSEAGAVVLYWNTGPGTGVAEPEAPIETVTLPFDDRAEKLRTDFSGARIFDSGTVAWRAHPSVPGWKFKPLAEAVDRSGAVCLVHIPADWTASEQSSGFSEHDSPPWLFVVSGDLRLDMAHNGARRELALREGAFLMWHAPAALCLPPESISDGGCTALCIGHDLSGSGAGSGFGSG